MDDFKEETLTGPQKNRNVSTLFTIRDMIMIVVTACSIASAFFMFEARLDLIERDAITSKEARLDIKQSLSDLGKVDTDLRAQRATV